MRAGSGRPLSPSHTFSPSPRLCISPRCGSGGRDDKLRTLLVYDPDKFTVDPSATAATAAPKGVVRAGGGRRRVEADAVVEEVVVVTEADVNPADLLAATDEVERRLSVEEDIERRTAQEHTDTPHFRKDAE